MCVCYSMSVRVRGHLAGCILGMKLGHPAVNTFPHGAILPALAFVSFTFSLSRAPHPHQITRSPPRVSETVFLLRGVEDDEVWFSTPSHCPEPGFEDSKDLWAVLLAEGEEEG